MLYLPVMKKLLLLLAATLHCFLSFSQEAESTGSTAELTVIPHLELVPNISDAQAAFNFGYSSLFTLFELSVSEHFSWVLVNKWLTVWDNDEGIPFGWQYTTIGRSDVSNFFVYCNAKLTFGSWNISLGKDFTSLGGFEYEAWDWDIQSNFMTPLCSSIQPYQWGGKVAWTTPSQMTTLSLQAVSSPFAGRPFSNGLLAYSAQWLGKYGWFSNIWSVSALGYEKGKYDWLFCLGQRATFDKWVITLDYNNSVGAAYEAIDGKVEETSVYHLVKGTTFAGTVCYSPFDWFDISLKGIWTTAGWSAGLLADFYPLKNSRDLKIHAGFTEDTFLGKPAATFNVGVRYNLGIHLW